MALVRFLHFLGTALWVGGAAAAVLLTIRVRYEPIVAQAAVYRLLRHVHTLVIGLGAVLTVGTGVVWTMWSVQSGEAERSAPTVGLWVMEGAGLIGGALVLLVGIPTAMKLAGLAVLTDDGQLLPAVDHYRRRQMQVSLVGGALALLALFTGVVL